MIDSPLQEFFAMGGYAVYVWSAYGATLLVLAVIWIDGARRRRAIERALAALVQTPMRNDGQS